MCVSLCVPGNRYAFYALVCGVVYVVGFPVGVFVILYRRRSYLFGDASNAVIAANRATFGFLYEVYGPTAWWWEVEELVRKLLLSAVVVLIESGSPLQVGHDVALDCVAPTPAWTQRTMPCTCCRTHR